MRINTNIGLLTLLAIAHSFLGIVGFAVVLWSLFIFLAFSGKFSLRVVQFVGLMPLLLIVVISIASSYFLAPFPFNSYFFSRDLFYFGSAAAMLLVGFYLGAKSPKPENQLWAFSIVLISISVVLFAPAIISGEVVSLSLATRYNHSLNSNLAGLAILIIISAFRTKLTFSTKRKQMIVLFIALLFVVASLSRVNIAIIAVAGVMVLLRPKTQRYVAFALLLVLAITPLIANQLGATTTIFRESAGFAQKVFSSVAEMAIDNRYDASSKNLHWRGYEAYLGIAAVEANGWLSIFAGLGLGSYVEGPFIDKLNVIPIFHNGFITVYVKSGVIGLLIFFYFLFRQASPQRPSKQIALSAADAARLTFLARLRVFMVVSLTIRTLSTHGILFPTPPLELLVLGMAHGARHRILYRKRSPRAQAVFVGSPVLVQRKSTVPIE